MSVLTFIYTPTLPVRKPSVTRKQVNIPRMQQQKVTTTVIPGISDLSSQYTCFLLDQFGVIHDGQRVYPGAHEALKNLRRDGKKLIILSNSSRRASSTIRNLQHKSIDSSLITGVVTSGELAFKALPEYAAKNPGARVLHFNWGSSSRSAVSITEHGFTKVAPATRTLHGVPVPDANNVDVIVAHGTTGLSCEDGSVVDIDWKVSEELLIQIAIANPNVPFFVANPDIVTVDGPELRPMPGALAQIFEKAGGRTIQRLGKPDPVAYKEALEIANVQPENVIAVGDSLAHDILGAADAGIDSLYIAGGINAERFNIDPEEGFVDEKKEWKRWNEVTLDQIIAEEAPGLGSRRPTYVPWTPQYVVGPPVVEQKQSFLASSNICCHVMQG